MNRYIAESLGTFVLVFAGCGAIVVNDITGGSVTHVGVALSFGLAVMAMIYSVGDISGAHLNPAVTLGFLVSGRMKRKDAGPYIASQVAGGIAAAAVLRLMFPEHQTLGSSLPADSVSQAFIMETILTFLLMVVILNVSTGAMEKGIMAGVAVGGTVAMEALFAGPVSGASMNPARSLAPALVSGTIEHLWIYLTATFAGAILAVPVVGLIRKK